MEKVRVFAPASASNLGPGFDVLGLALERPGDVVEASWCDEPGVRIAEITGGDGSLTTDPHDNVVGVAAASAWTALAKSEADRWVGPTGACGVQLRLHKQMPLASGLGSSAASSVAGAMAVNELCGGPLSRRDLLAHALAGERSASGTVHADNVAPCLLGGIVLVRSCDPLEVIELPVPDALRVVVVHPHHRVETARARALVRDSRFTIEPVVTNLGNVASFVAALYRDDLELLGRCIEDRLVEPLRIPLIPGFAALRAAARRAGALGCSVSGSGPAVFALATSDAAADRIAGEMAEALRASVGIEADLYVGPVNRRGACRVE